MYFSKLKKPIFCFLLAMLTCSCTYMKYVSVQREYRRIQNTDPSQGNLKHLIDSKNTFVAGTVLDANQLYAASTLAVVAYSDQFEKDERVDSMLIVKADTHYGLNLPQGDFRITVFADRNLDGLYEHSEVVGLREISIGEEMEMVVSGFDIQLLDSIEHHWIEPISVPSQERVSSLFYPAGAIRQLDDPIYEQSMATLGMFAPAAFIEKCPTMFYALEEDLSYKIPVVFVHGINGSPRSFEPLIASMDRTRYKPWFFYYPSGGDLDQLAKLFYDVLLSGKGVPHSEMPMVVVAHSMGGLIVREAINLYKGREGENRVVQFISVASPFGGMPGAAVGEKHGLMVLPVWRDLNPEGAFIEGLFRKPLPAFLSHHLVYAYDDEAFITVGKNGDGVVSLSSQLDSKAQAQAVEQFGFESGHVSILKNEDLISYVVGSWDQVENRYPADHLEYLRQGGFDVELSESYHPRTVYLIRTVGKYLLALARGRIDPIHVEQEHFIEVIKGDAKPANFIEKEVLDFWTKNPNLQ